MTMTYKTVSGTVTRPDSNIGIRAKVTVTPLSTNHALTFTGDDRITVGPVVVETASNGVLPALKIPTNVDLSGLVWRITAEAIDPIPGMPKRWTVKNAVSITGTGTALLRDLAEVDVLTVDATVVASVSDYASAADASKTAAAGSATTAAGWADAAASSAADADTSADLADTSADTATTAASTATTKATEASTSATTATTKASEAAASASHAEDMAGAAEAVAVSNDTIIAGRINDPASATATALTASIAQQQKNLELFRAAVRGGKITASRPLVPIGDSHTDNTTAAQYMWQQITNYRTQPGEGLEGVPSAGLVPKGLNGQTLSYYLANLAQTGGFNDAMALAPYAVMPCWLTNDVRQGALGLTTDAIRAAGAALLNQLLDLIKANANRPEFIILRVPAPYTTVDGGEHYINDGAGNVNPAGLAQIYTDGVRLAYYDVLAQHPDVLLYDPQIRLFGTTSPTSNDNANGYFGNQIHQSQKGYWAEGDDFAAWVDAAQPRKEGRAFEARRTTPLTPWTAYYREVEDTARYTLIGEGIVTTDRPDTSTFIDIGPSFPGLAPGNIMIGDIVEILGAKTSIQIPTSSTITAQGTNTRIVLGSGTVGVAVAYQHKVKVWRRKASPTDAAFNSILEDTSYDTKLVGRVQGSGNSGNTFVTIATTSIDGKRPQGNAKDWVYRISPGDKLYVEGLGSTVVRTLGSGDFVQQGNSVRILNVADTGHNYNGDDGLLAVIVGTHGDTGYGKDTANSVSASGAAQTIPDPATGPRLNAITLTANCTLTFPASVIGRRFDLVLTQDATGSRTVTWPGTVKWAGGTAPTLTTTAAKKDWVRFVYDGSAWLGEVVAQNL